MRIVSLFTILCLTSLPGFLRTAELKQSKHKSIQNFQEELTDIYCSLLILESEALKTTNLPPENPIEKSVAFSNPIDENTFCSELAEYEFLVCCAYAPTTTNHLLSHLSSRLARLPDANKAQLYKNIYQELPAIKEFLEEINLPDWNVVTQDEAQNEKRDEKGWKRFCKKNLCAFHKEYDPNRGFMRNNSSYRLRPDLPTQPFMAEPARTKMIAARARTPNQISEQTTANSGPSSFTSLLISLFGEVS